MFFVAVTLTPYPEPPVKCFGLLQDSIAQECAICTQRTGCAERMGKRLNRVNLDALKIELLPEEFKVPAFGDFRPEERDMQAIFAVCHRLVFGTDSAQSIRHKEKVAANARKAKCSLHMFLITNMAVHQKTDPGNPFNPSILADGRSLSRAIAWGDACRKKYASFDLTALDILLKSDTTSYEIDKRMLDSEMEAAAWIVEFKLWHEGKPYVHLFTSKEAVFDPNWLAIEPHYEDFIKAELHSQSSGSLREFRRDAIQALIRLKTHKHQAIGNFRARERAVKQTLVKILAKFKLLPEHLQAVSKPVHDPLHLWHRIGLAIQHVECRRLLNGEPSVYAEKPNTNLKSIRGDIPLPAGIDQ